MTPRSRATARPVRFLAEAIDAKLNVSMLDAIPWRVCALLLARVHQQVGQISTDISVSVYVPVLEINQQGVSFF